MRAKPFDPLCGVTLPARVSFVGVREQPARVWFPQLFPIFLRQFMEWRVSLKEYFAEPLHPRSQMRVSVRIDRTRRAQCGPISNAG